MSALTRDDRPNRVRSTGIAMAVDGTMNGAFNFVTNRTWILLALPSPLSSFIFIFVSSYALSSARLRRKRSSQKKSAKGRGGRRISSSQGLTVFKLACSVVNGFQTILPRFGTKKIGYLKKYSLQQYSIDIDI